MLIENVDYFVKLIDFPTCACGGFVTPNDDGTFTIYLNSRLSFIQNCDSMAHELNHIAHDDFYRSVPLDVKEREAG